MLIDRSPGQEWTRREQHFRNREFALPAARSLRAKRKVRLYGPIFGRRREPPIRELKTRSVKFVEIPGISVNFTSPPVGVRDKLPGAASRRPAGAGWALLPSPPGHCKEIAKTHHQVPRMAAKRDTFSAPGALFSPKPTFSQFGATFSEKVTPKAPSFVAVVRPL